MQRAKRLDKSFKKVGKNFKMQKNKQKKRQKQLIFTASLWLKKKKKNLKKCNQTLTTNNDSYPAHWSA